MSPTPEAREGDVNLSPIRAAWRASLSEATRAALDEDERYFLHQSLSTPCLDEIVAAEGATLIDIERRRKILDFHGNSVHQLGYGHPRVVAAVKARARHAALLPAPLHQRLRHRPRPPARRDHAGALCESRCSRPAARPRSAWR